MQIAVIDYGAGNLYSVCNILNKIVEDSSEVKVISEVDDLDFVPSHVILPGVGSFSDAVDNLNAKPFLKLYLQKWVREEKVPFLGICVGMQLLATVGFENEEVPGFDWISGEVKKMPVGEGLKIPHMGWNSIEVCGGDESLSKFSAKDFYFVHSFYFSCKNKGDILASSKYGDDFPAIIGRDNILGCQFHPEKSSDNGVGFLREFLKR
jgi:glutamine amidotransferase